MNRARLCVVVQRLAATLMLSTAPFVAVERAGAACDPPTSVATPVTNTTVTCTNTTTDQNTDGISNFGYGTGHETGITIDVQSGASVTATGISPNTSGILVHDGTINNQGLVTVRSFRGFGIQALGNITVNNSGNINFDTTGHGDHGVFGNGLDLTVNNAATGIIFGSLSGVSMSRLGGTLNVTNAGIIQSVVDVSPNAAIRAETVNVINVGQIVAAGPSSTAIEAFGDATVTNTVNGSSIGQIIGGLFGINATNVNVTNSGQIESSLGTAIHATGTATVSNTGDGNSTGLIIGVLGDGISAGTVNVISNTGLIESRALNGSAINAVTGSANVTNSGLIESFGTAIHATGTATVSNTGDGNGTGLILGRGDGISAGTVNVISNTGLIQSRGLNGSAIDAVTGSANVTNTGGLIQAIGANSTAINATGDATVTNTVNGSSIGLITGNLFGINATNVNVTNSGQIEGSFGTAIHATGTATVSNTGDGNNTGLIIGLLADGISAGTVNVISNTGLIESRALNGSAINAVTGSANVTNTGGLIRAISANSTAINATGDATVTNTVNGSSIGQIIGSLFGINAVNVNVTNTGGLIQATGANSTAINATGDATVTNTVSGSSIGLVEGGINATNVNVTNSGRIASFGPAIHATGTATVSNARDGNNIGLITGLLGDGISAGTVNVISNTGLIESQALNGSAINAETGSANVTNTGGLIQATGANSTGIRATGDATVTNTVNGSSIGQIVGTLFGINATNVNVTNNGRIAADTATGGTAIHATGTATVTNSAPGIILGNASAISAQTVDIKSNSGTIEATANAGGAGGVAIDGDVVTVTNSGIIRENGIGGRAINANVSPASQATVNNLAGGTIIADGLEGTAITTATANVINAGTIQAANGIAIDSEGATTLTNLAGGAVTGVIGVRAGLLDVTNGFGATISGGVSGIEGSGIVRNAGTITGGTASVSFNGAGPNTLILQTGSVLNGDAVGSTAAGAVNNLTLQGSGTASNNFLNFNTLDVQAGGTWIWNSNGSGTFGQTTVSSGTFAVDGLLFSPVSVNPGGVLAGRGTIFGAVSVAGTVAPGAVVPFSTLSVHGNVDFTSGSIYRVNINAAGQSDKLQLLAGGAATLTGGTVNVASRNSFAPFIPYTILTATGGLGGTTFSAVSSSLASAFLTPSLSYDANDVFLTLVAGNGSGTIGFANVAQTRNQRAVANALEASPLTDPLVLAVLTQSAAGARQAFDALSGEVFGSLHNAQAETAQFARGAILGRLRQASYADAPGGLSALGFAGPQLAQLAYAAGDANGFAAKAAPGAPATSRDLTFWAQGLGGWGRTDSDGNAASLTSRFGGFLSGVDARFGDTLRAGLVAGFVRSDLNAAARSSSAGIDSAQFGGYAGGRVGAFNVRGGASLSIDSIDTSRAIFFPGFTDKASTRFHGNVGQMFGEVGYGMAFDQVAVEPLAGLAYVHLRDGAFVESGGTAALSGSSANENIGYSFLGARVATAVPLANGTVLVPRGLLQWQYAFGDVTPVTALAFEGTGARFSVAGVPIARNTALVEGGFDWRFSPEAKLGAFYQGELAAHAQTHAVKGAFTWDF